MQPYQHFTLEERESLCEKRARGESIRRIAIEMGRNASSISRELKRNCNKDGGYHPWRATICYIVRRQSCRRPYRLKQDEELLDYVKRCMDKYWSPEIIAAKWKQMHPEATLSHTTIYRALKRKQIEGYSAKSVLRRRGRRKNTHQSHTIHPEHLIRERPEDINTRERIGDWEGDTIYGAIGKGYLVTCVERKSRYLRAGKLVKRSEGETRQVIREVLCGLPVLSLSLDNGSEFSAFKGIEEDLQATVYFADPHSPWQRGSNENINGLLRFFFPKGTNFHAVTQEEIDQVLMLINTRPRKCLGWLSPHEVMFSKCCT